MPDPVRVTLINPPQIFSRGQVASGVTPPLGVAYLAAYLEKHDVPVGVIDALGEAPERITPFRRGTFLRGLTFAEIVRRIPEDAGLVGISNLFTFAYPAVEQLCVDIRAARPRARLILGGPHPSALYDDVLRERPEVDFVALGEGERSLYLLCQYLSGALDLSYVSGIAMRGDAGDVKVLQATKRIDNLGQENVPFPARHLLPMENYIRTQESHGPSSGRWTSILSSRGCPYGCTFCESRRTKWVARPASDVVDEMEHCMREYGITEFHFEDDNMTIHRGRLIELCDEIIRRKLDICWQTPNGIRASVTDAVMLGKMKESGCTHITLAPETGSPRVLEEIVQKGKDFSLDQLKECGRLAHGLKMKVAAYFILGLPGETREEMAMTVSYARDLARVGVDEAAFGLFIPLPGTPLWDGAAIKARAMDFLDLLAVGDLNRAVSFNSAVTDQELKRYRLKAYMSFHLTRLLYHPLAFLRSFLNVLRNIEETKTERTLRQFLKRLGIRQKKFRTADVYPYEAGATMKVLLTSTPNYAYEESMRSAMRSLRRLKTPDPRPKT